MFILEGINTPIMCRNTEECHLTNSFHLIFEFGCPTSTEHENVGQNPPRSKKTRSQSTRSQNRVELCSLATQLKDSQKKSLQNSTQGKCLLKFLVSPLLCKAGGSEIRNLVKVKETSKKKFPQQNLSNWAPQSERGPAAKKLPLGCSKLRPSSWTSQLNRLGLFRGTPNAVTAELKPKTESSQRSSEDHSASARSSQWELMSRE